MTENTPAAAPSLREKMLTDAEEHHYELAHRLTAAREKRDTLTAELRRITGEPQIQIAGARAEIRDLVTAVEDASALIRSLTPKERKVKAEQTPTLTAVEDVTDTEHGSA